MPDDARGRLLRRQVVAAVGLVAASAATHALWLGWDDEYQTDPATGVRSGPYEAWQVEGAVLCLIGIAVVAGLLRRARLASVAMPLGFAGAWSVQAQDDESGLWLVGAVMVSVGLFAGAWAVAGAATWLRDTAATWRRR